MLVYQIKKQPNVRVVGMMSQDTELARSGAANSYTTLMLGAHCKRRFISIQFISTYKRLLQIQYATHGS